MLKEILSISGRPGLYRLVSRTKNSLIVEFLDPQNKKRMPVYSVERVASLADISVFTTGEDLPLRAVFKALQEKNGGAEQPVEGLREGSDFSALMAEIVPEYDVNRVHISDIKKIVKWYNLLVQNSITDFEPQEPQEGAAAPQEEEQPAQE